MQILGTNVDTIHQAYCPGAVRYVVTAEGEALTPQLGEMTALMDPQRSDTAGKLSYAMAPAKDLSGRTPFEGLRSDDAPRRSPG